MNGFLTELDLCKAIAYEAHAGQWRRGGDAYIEHPLRVASMMDNDTLRCVAVLHDVLEDTYESVETLRAKMVSEPVIAAVKCLTKNDSVSYADYIKEIKLFGSGLAMVKIADMFDNLCGEPTQNQKKKYRMAMGLLYS